MSTEIKKDAKVFTRNITLAKMTALFATNRAELEGKTLRQIHKWVLEHPDFDFKGEDSVNQYGIKTALQALKITPKGGRVKSKDGVQDRAKSVSSIVLRLAEKMEKAIGAEPGTIISDDDRAKLRSLSGYKD